MNTTKFLGNCKDIIDWDSIIKDLLDQTAPTIGPSTAGGKDKHTPEYLSNSKQFLETKKLWDEIGYKSVEDGGSAEWHMFYPTTNFDQSVIDRFVEFYNIEKYNSCWISMIMPGRCAPWHVDQYKVLDNIKRYHCHIGEPETGHVFMIEDEYYTNVDKGNAYSWNSVYAWHAGFNAGRSPKFLLNLY